VPAAPPSVRLALACAAAGFHLVGCAQPPLVVDASPGLEITIDGAYEDWRGRFTRIDPKRSVGLGATRDADNLYLCLVARDLGVQTLLRRAGFTLWIDPDGGQRTRLGLRVAPLVREEGEETPDRGAAVAPRIEIVRNGAEYGYQLAETGAAGTVEASTAQKTDVVVYEFRLALDTPLDGARGTSALTSVPSRGALGLGIVTEVLEIPDLPRGAPRPPDIAPLRAWTTTADSALGTGA
jgi:hypothetical protein